MVAAGHRMTVNSQERPGGESGLRRGGITEFCVAVFQEDLNATCFTLESFPS